MEVQSLKGSNRGICIRDGPFEFLGGGGGGGGGGLGYFW